MMEDENLFTGGGHEYDTYENCAGNGRGLGSGNGWISCEGAGSGQVQCDVSKPLCCGYGWSHYCKQVD